MSDDLTPELLAKARAKVAEARKAGFSDSDISDYLRDEIGATLGQVMDAKGRDYARAAGMGATMGFLDELTGAGAALIPGGKGYTAARDEVRANYDAAQAANPKSMLAAEVIASLPAIFATGGAGAAVRGAGLGARVVQGGKVAGLLGAASSAGHSDEAAVGGVAKDAAIGGVLGGAIGAGAPVVGAVGGRVARGVADAVSPTRAIVREAATQLPNSAAATLARQEALAPGTAVLANLSPEMQALTRGVGADARTGVAARLSGEARVDALKAAKTALGKEYDALNVVVPVDATLKFALATAGRKSLLPKGATTVELKDVLGVRSALLAEGRATKNDAVRFAKNRAAESLTNWMTTHAPDLARVDKDYGFLARQTKAAGKVARELTESSKNHATSRAYGSEAGSVGGSLPSGSRGIADLLAAVFRPDRAARARAVDELLLTPGDATQTALQKILKARAQMNAPPGRGSRMAGAAVRGSPALIGPLRSLLQD